MERYREDLRRSLRREAPLSLCAVRAPQGRAPQGKAPRQGVNAHHKAMRPGERIAPVSRGEAGCACSAPGRADGGRACPWECVWG
jgi:hypothetical protein